MHETFGSLIRDRAHWEFELFLMLLFDGVIAGLLAPFVRKHWKHHVRRDREETVWNSLPAGAVAWTDERSGVRYFVREDR